MIFNYLLDNFKRFGIKRLLYDLTYKFLEKMFNYMKIQGMTLTLSSIDPTYFKPINGYKYRFLTETELREYTKDPSNQLDIEFIEAALAKGHKCLGIIDQKALAAYGWYSKIDTHARYDLELCFNKQWVYMYRGYTSPTYRGQRLHAIGMGKALEKFSKKGALGLISLVETNNFRSLRSVYRLGYCNFGKVRAIKIFGKWRIKADKACQQYGFTLKPTGVDKYLTSQD